MSEANDPRPAVAPPLFWRVLVVANLLSLGVLMLAFYSMTEIAIMPDLAHWFLLAGVLMIVPAVWYQQRSRLLASQRPAGQSENAAQLGQLNRLVVGCALAELPGLMATIYYLFAREWIGTLALLGITVILLLRAQPR